MSFTIPNAHVEQFSRKVLDVAQQQGSKLRRTLMEEPVIGKSGNFERIGKVEMQERTGRHVDTPLISTPHSRRRLDIKDWEIADLVDEADRLKVIINPQSDYARVFGFAAGRKIDSEILSKLNGISIDGDGATVAFDAANSPSLDLGTTATAVDLQLIIDARTKMLENDVDEGEPLHIAIDGSALRQLLGQAGTSTNKPIIGSSDFATIRAIQNGEIKVFLGFTWHVVSPSVMPKGAAANDRFMMFWSEMGGKLGMQQEPKIRISERADKSYSTQVYISTNFGVVRMDEPRVGRILFGSTQAPT